MVGPEAVEALGYPAEGTGGRAQSRRCRRLRRRSLMAAGATRMHRYSKMTEEEIKLDRYAKFRKLGQYEEFLVTGGAWKEARAERESVSNPKP